MKLITGSKREQEGKDHNGRIDSKYKYFWAEIDVDCPAGVGGVGKRLAEEAASLRHVDVPGREAEIDP
jgi:hypothetical protein